MAETKNDGGQAFPLPIAISPAGDEHIAYAGMSLRDYFAAKAMAAMLGSDVGADSDKDVLAREAYAYADFMIAERSK